MLGAQRVNIMSYHYHMCINQLPEQKHHFQHVFYVQYVQKQQRKNQVSALFGLPSTIVSVKCFLKHF